MKGKEIKKKVKGKANNLKENTKVEEKIIIDINKDIKPIKKVAIVGYAPSSRDLAPYDDQTFEIWGVNELYKLGKRIDILFELHERKWFRSKERNPQHLEWLQNSPIPIFMLEQFPDMPKSIRYPIEEIKKYFYPFDNYFTNSISYMIALAIYSGYEEIQVFGVDMATSVEYMYQRPSIEYFLGVAVGKGIKVYVPPQADLMKTMYQYGYENDQQTQTVLKIKARKNELSARAQGYKKQAEDSIAALNTMLGAIDDIDYWERCWINSQDNKNENNLEV